MAFSTIGSIHSNFRINNYGALLVYPPLTPLTTFGTTTLSNLAYGNGSYITTATGIAAYFGNGPFYNSIELNAANRWQVGASYTVTSTFNGNTIYSLPANTILTTVSGVSYNGYWLQIEFPYRIKLEKYSITPRVGQNVIQNLVVAGSNDNTNWTLLGQMILQSLPKQNERFHFNVSTSTKYKQYRIIKISGFTAAPSIFDFQFYSYDKGPFSENPYLISINGVPTSTINTTNKQFWGFCGGNGNDLILACYNDSGTGASPYFFSSNNGNTWTLPTVPHNRVSPYANFRQPWVSFNGVHRIMVNNSVNVYVSSNSGVTWTASNAPNARYQGAYVSEDGNLKLVNNNNSFAYRLRNNPTTNSFASAPSTGTVMARGTITGSGSGQYIIAYTGSAGNIQFSNDYAATWINIASRLPGYGTAAGGVSTMSFTGQYIYIAVQPYRLWRSQDYGATFSAIHGTGGLLNTTTYTSNFGYQALVSYTGQYVVVSAYINQGTSPAAPNGYSFISTNYGVTFGSPKLIPIVNPAIDPAFVTGTITHSSNGTPIRAIIPCYNAGVFYIDF